jgi:multiple sugar transport system substrate-binding protein
VAACAPAAPVLEPATITFACPDFEIEHYQRLAGEFMEAYPMVTVELLPRNWDALGGLSPQEADAFVSSQFALTWMQDQGTLLNLSPFLEGDEEFDQGDLYPGMLNLYTVDGKVWGVPAGVDMIVMYYNQDLFDQQGAPYPEPGWTWDDFLYRADAVTDPYAETWGYVPNYDFFDPILFVYQHGGRIFDDLQNPTETTFDDPVTIEALEWYLGLQTDYQVAPTPQQVSEFFSGQIYTGILAGKVGMWTGLLSDRGGSSWPVEWPMAWGVVPLPRDEQAATLTLVNGYFISGQTTHPEAAWAWVRFLSKQLPGTLVPARRSLVESSAFEQLIGTDVARTARAAMDDALLLSPELAEFENALQIFGTALGQVLSGQATLDEAMSAAQERAQSSGM